MATEAPPLTLRVASWNVRFSSKQHATAQGSYLKGLDTDVVLLQDVNAAAATWLSEAAGLDWLDCSLAGSLRGVPPT
ncbi:MAG: hypothetical protein LBJ87_09900, partial [bacterium]|nr:hypothetical protein [bacterium]